MSKKNNQRQIRRKDAFVFYTAEKPSIEHTLLLANFCRKHGHEPNLINVQNKPSTWKLHRLPKYKNAPLTYPICKLGDAWYKVDTTELIRICLEDSQAPDLPSPLPEGRFEPYTEDVFWDTAKKAIRQTTDFKDLRMLYPDTLEVGYDHTNYRRTIVRLSYNDKQDKYRADIRQQGVSCSLQRNSIVDIIDAILEEI